MPVLNFSKWSPGGNTTLFFPATGLDSRQQTALASKALEPHSLGAEQAGFVDMREHRLRMAGGEFCVNASRAFGALLAFQEFKEAGSQAKLQGYEQHYEISVSGWPDTVDVYVQGCAPHWQVRAELDLPEIDIEPLAQGMSLVRLPGITHILLDPAHYPMPDAPEQIMEDLRHTWQLENEPAVGAIWWRAREKQLEMFPLVHVRDACTTILESACGSGALALAMLLSTAEDRSCHDILQPSGSSLTISLLSSGQGRLARIGGPVDLVACGQTWLPDVPARESCAPSDLLLT